MFQSRTLAWITWILASLFYAYQYILRVMPNIMMGDILKQYDMDAATFGQFSGIYYIGYCLMHLPVGIMLDRYGPKKVMPLCIFMTVIGMLPLIFSDFWVYPLMGRALIGMGSSAAILGTFKIIRLTFREDNFTRMLSLSVTIGLMGALYGGVPVSYMCDLFGNKVVITIFSLLGVVLGILIYLIVPNVKSVSSSFSIIVPIKAVFSSPKVMGICFFAGMMVGPLEGFADVWGAGFFKQVYDFDNLLAVGLTSTIYLGMCFGGPLLSLIAEKSGYYLGTIVAAGLIMALSFCILLMGSVPSYAISMICIVVGICSAYQIIAIYKASTYVSDNEAGLTTAVANMIIMIFGAIFHSVIGWVINITGGVEDSMAYTFGIIAIPVALIIGSIGFMSIIMSEYDSEKYKTKGMKKMA